MKYSNFAFLVCFYYEQILIGNLGDIKGIIRSLTESYNEMAKRNRTKRQTMDYKIIHRCYLLLMNTIRMLPLISRIEH